MFGRKQFEQGNQLVLVFFIRAFNYLFKFLQVKPGKRDFLFEVGDSRFSNFFVKEIGRFS